MSKLAVVGMACRYPDATSPRELWENALAGRRAFRRLPAERMNPDDYWDADPAAPDKFYARNAAVITDWTFDRVAHKVAGSTYRSTDLTHWLALDVAGRALADAGFPAGDGLPRERTGVVVGNTLTGEFTRANVLRLRWPYVRRAVAATLSGRDGWDDARLGEYLAELEAVYKDPFPEIDEDSLAGGLSNTIAGRVCNFFDLKGGGYTVDGACSSSLLSVATACKALLEGDIDVAVAGGVDLSIDPFEIIGFAKTGALARGEMKLYDRRSNGFWPGEGAGMIVLMREEEARAADHRVYATIAGWGISSDGHGGITRPEVSGYRLALDRAYERAGFDIASVPMFEGHGTGTEVGDRTELTALSEARRAADGAAPPAAISSIKAMIGHTKAAAGVAGLIKAVMAVHDQLLPPTLGCVDPHPVLTDDDPALRALRRAEAWPKDAAPRAGVTAMGFGGINTHIVVEGAGPRRRVAMDSRTRTLTSALQDTELLLVDGDSPAELRDRLASVADFALTLSYAQIGDLAATLHRELRDRPHRAAVVVSSPEDAERRLRALADVLAGGETRHHSADGRSHLARAGRARIGLLFPGQGSGTGTSGGALRRRLPEVEDVYANAELPDAGDMVATAVAQPRIVTGSLAALAALAVLGIEGEAAVGHSLGELSALHWAGAVEESALLRLATERGRAMTEHGLPGTMAGLAAPPAAVDGVIAGLDVVIAGHNGPEQTVIAGTEEAVTAAGANAERAGITWTRLPVSHAFHSPLVAPAAEVFGARLDEERFGRVGRRVISTVTGETLRATEDLAALLRRQITDPVLFAPAVALAAKDVDLFVEAGPGRVLTGLATAVSDVPALALDTDQESLAGLLGVAGAAYVLGAPVRAEALFHGRLLRPLEVGQEFAFLTNPCETLPRPPAEIAASAPAPARTGGADADEDGGDGESTLELLRRMVSQRVELPPELIGDDTGLLDELHLSSITVGEIVNRTTQKLGLPVAQTPMNFATATLRQLAEALDAAAAAGGDAGATEVVVGAAAWARAFRVDLDEEPLAPHTGTSGAAAAGRWSLHDPGGVAFAEPLRRALERAQGGTGTLLCLPPGCGEGDVLAALQAARGTLGGEAGTRFVLVQHGGRGAAGLARTLRQEAPHLRVTIVGLPDEAPEPDAVTALVLAEVAATTEFSEAHHGADGVRRVPVLRAMPVAAGRTEPPLDGTDVLLVSGGGKGITAECALALATSTGAALALLGRSDPDQDEELAANLRRMRDAGARVAYARADVTDPDRVRAAVAELTAATGPVTAVLHGAGRNEPAALAALTPEDVRATFAPKIDGLRAVLDAVDPGDLKLLVTFGSIIGRAGLRGEAHYATANEWLADLTTEFGEQHPGCRALCLEWSVWSGVGMGERLSVVEGLAREGITAVTPDQGIEILHRLLADPETPPVVVISGRTGTIDTVRHDRPALPLLRFAERPLVRYHGVEMVAEVELNAGTDPYLADHLLDGNLLFPAVLGLEALAQVAASLRGEMTAPVFEDVEFSRPILVPPEGGTTVRIAAVATADDTVEAVIRSAETGYAVEHFRARLRYGDAAIPEGAPDQVGPGVPPVPLDPARDLYGGLLFQGARFQRLRRYHRAAARHVDAEVAAEQAADWFAAYLPAGLLLGDPGARDALMHGNQVCVPHATLLPSGIERVWLRPDGTPYGPLRYSATERSRDGDVYVYDIAVRTEDGDLVERWEGLRLHAVRKGDGAGPWPVPLLGGYVERVLEDVTGARVAVAAEPDTEPAGERRAATELTLTRALGRPAGVRHRPDGRPELPDGPTVSASHGAGLTLGTAAPGPLACDVESVVGRDGTDWEGLLGRHHRVARAVADDSGEPFDAAATRTWSAWECLRKAGLPDDAPLTLAGARQGAWTVFASGALRVATCVTTVRDRPDPVVVAVLVEGRS
ncbi:SDR family NAD(P)-dependent oxidoreductase [Actinomadura flavalba]|uniref:type I polyketide synthase n=1 Tax=Actinomadura flavalba TaxID=1120938 RepID=UPI000378740C|nr:type I polyketide synthase [Actinomadura flavalba]